MIRSGKTFNFGKWKGFTVGEVAQRDPSYIYFCENKMGYRFSPKVKRIANLANQRRRISRLMAAEFDSFASL
ncbi:UNVERIFIED_CONTAM: hypothetical protein RF648_20280, partial [Kocuria sp. CPCC 205274]